MKTAEMIFLNYWIGPYSGNLDYICKYILLKMELPKIACNDVMDYLHWASRRTSVWKHITHFRLCLLSMYSNSGQSSMSWTNTT